MIVGCVSADDVVCECDTAESDSEDEEMAAKRIIQQVTFC